jgi:hypothetical protein
VEAVVEIVKGHLTINVTDNVQTLMPAAGRPRRLTSTINVVSFQMVGQREAYIRFFMSGENLMGLYYEVRRENEDLVIGIAAPKFSGLSS